MHDSYFLHTNQTTLIIKETNILFPLMNQAHDAEEANLDAFITRVVNAFSALTGLDVELVRNVYEEQHAFNDPPEPPEWYGVFEAFLKARQEES